MYALLIIGQPAYLRMLLNQCQCLLSLLTLCSLQMFI